MKSSKKKKIIIWSVVGVVVIAVFLFFKFHGGKMEMYRVISEPSQRDSIEITVTATGEIQPVNKVEVGTQVSGIVQKLYVDYNSHVTKGQLLAELDRSTLQEQVNQAQANVTSAQSALTLSKQNFERVKALYENKAATQEKYEEASNQYVQAQNQLVTAKSDLQRAQVNLSYAQIYSPIDGIVLSKSVEQGQTVASSFSTPTIFTIANDLTQMQVEANVDEADIGQVHVGQPVHFTVDAFPDINFTGTVRQVRLEPVVTNNVVTYTVIIDAPNPEEKLMPGMTASVNITVEKKGGVTVPLDAIYFTLNKEVQDVLAKQGIMFKGLYNSEEEEAKSLRDITKKTIWVKNGNTYEQRQVVPGLNDGTRSIILEGLKEGEEVVRSVQQGRPTPKSEGGSFMKMGPPEKKKR
ncbi:MAG: efflux RND transporter periplasmic adaptor subunit [Bacteroidales bacterium]|nr:efflux RND transporter periplasmic adaptor subunit [Bacteroidales bacterium]